VLQHIEFNGFGQRAALADGDDVTLAQVLEAGGAVHGHVGVSLLKSNAKHAETR